MSLTNRRRWRFTERTYMSCRNWVSVYTWKKNIPNYLQFNYIFRLHFSFFLTRRICIEVRTYTAHVTSGETEMILIRRLFIWALTYVFVNRINVRLTQLRGTRQGPTKMLSIYISPVSWTKNPANQQHICQVKIKLSRSTISKQLFFPLFSFLPTLYSF